MKLTQQSVCLLAILASSLISNHVAGVVIRDDVPDSEYIALGADPRYEATGAWFSGASHECNATVLGPSWILTAGHCGGSSFGLGEDINNLTVEVDLTTQVRNPDFNTANAALGPDTRVAELATPILDVTPALSLIHI